MLTFDGKATAGRIKIYLVMVIQSAPEEFRNCEYECVEWVIFRVFLQDDVRTEIKRKAVPEIYVFSKNGRVSGSL